MKVCPQCQYQNQDQVLRCANCGAELPQFAGVGASQPSQGAYVPPSSNSPQTAFCPYCGQTVHPQAYQCNHCGTRLAQFPAVTQKDGSGYRIAGIVFAVVSLGFCPPLFGVLGIWMGSKAKSMGDPHGGTVMTASAICMAIGIAFGVIIGVSRLGVF